jgi:uncharacterized repeat protein (TIGR01451 family)
MKTNNLSLTHLFAGDDLELSPLLGGQESLLSILAAAQNLTKVKLQAFAQTQDFAEKMTLAFGERGNFTDLQNAWKAGEVAFPSIEIHTTTELNGAYGAFSQTTGKIYLAQELLEKHDLELVTAVLLEEYGHFVDNQLNRRDTPGDEGAIFSTFVRGSTLAPEQIQPLKAEDDTATVTLDNQVVQIEQATVSDSGGFEGSFQTVTLDEKGGGTANFRYQHFSIPDNFIIRYEGKNILETGFVGGSNRGTVQIPKGNSNQLEVIVATDDEGTLWNYDVTTLSPGINIQDAYAEVPGGSSQTATLKFPVTLSEASDAETTVNYFTLVGTAVDGVTGSDRIDYRPVTGTLTFAPGETKKEIEIAVLGDTPVNFGSNKNFEVFARDTAYRDWKKGGDVDLNSSLSYKDLGYRVDEFFTGGNDFQAVGLTSAEKLFVVISEPVNGKITKDSTEEKNRLLNNLKDFFGGDTNSSAYNNATQEINKLQGQDASWTFATGTIYDQGKAPVLAIRGTASGQDAWDDANPNGVGYAQFTANKNTVNQWLQSVSKPKDTNISFKPHITGHSLGGALTQWVAADYSSQGKLGDIVTFNSPGISFDGANSFAGADKVTHYITSTDVVSLAGFRFIPGQYTLLNETFSTFNQVPVEGPHTHPVLINTLDRTGASKPSNLGQKPFPSVDSLNSLLFTYLPDPDYFVFLIAVSKIPVLGPPVAVALRYRGTAEAARTTIGAALYAADFALEFAKEVVQAAWNAAKRWSTAAWDAIKEWGEAAWDGISSWTTAAWDATTQWVSNAWDATKQWGSDAWDATKQWGSDAWDATKQWGSDAWDATKQWGSDAWNATKTLGSEFWEATKTFGSEFWEATTNWFDSILPFSSSLRAAPALEETSINRQQTLKINSSWEAITYWTPEAWQATAQWSDVAWKATTQWTLDVWQATTEWSPEVWQTTTRWTDDIWQATTKLNGAAGDRILFGTPGNNNLSGGSGNYILDGLDGNDILDGREGNDILRGGSGNDVLTGGTGSDSFAFDSPTEGVDTIVDFKSGESDRIVISAAGFGGGLTPDAVLKDSQFVLGTAAADSDDRFIYDPATGNLFFDPDGTGNAPQQQIATLTGAPSLSAANIFVSGNAKTPAIKITAPATAEANLSVTQTASAAVGAGKTLTYTIQVTNNGAVTSKGVTLIETLPEPVTFVSASLTPSQQTENIFTFNLGDLAAGESKTVEINVVAPAFAQTITTSAAVTSETADPEATNDVANVSTAVTVPELPDLTVTRTDNAGTVNLKDTYTYDLTVTNRGSIAATGVVLKENLPSGVNYISTNTAVPLNVANGIVTANLGQINPGESKTVNLAVSSILAGNLLSTAQVTSNEIDSNSLNNLIVARKTVNSTVPAGIDLELTQTVNNPNPAIGDRVSFTLTLTNRGPGVATNIKVKDILPAGLGFVSASTAQGTYDSNTGIWDVGNMRDNLSRSLTITAQVNSGLSFSNTAEVMSVFETDIDSIPNNNNPNEDDQATVNLGSKDKDASLIWNPANSTFSNTGSSSNILVTLTQRTSDRLNEIGLFKVDNAQGTIDGIAPDAPGYLELALKRSQIVFSALTNLPNGYTLSPTRTLALDSDSHYRFYLVKNSTTDAVLSGKTPISQVSVASPSSFQVTNTGLNDYTLAWEDGSGNPDFADISIQAQITAQSIPDGASLQGNSQSEILDFRSFSGSKINAEFTVHREAGYNNYVGFYKISNPQGAIADSLTGLSLNPGDSGYVEAAVRNRIAGIDLQVTNQSTAVTSAVFEGGSLFAPFMIANGSPSQILDANRGNNPAVYFAFLGANPDGVDHIRLLGDNVFGFEDLPRGGDFDYNDMIVRIKLAVV